MKLLIVLALGIALNGCITSSTPLVDLSRRQGIPTCDAFFSADSSCASAHSTDVKAYFACFCTDQNVKSGICANNGNDAGTLDLKRYYLLASCTAYMDGDETDAEACYAVKDPDTPQCQAAVKETGGGSGLNGAPALSAGASSSTAAATTTMRTSSSSTTGAASSRTSTAPSSGSTSSSSGGVSLLSRSSLTFTVAVAAGVMFAL